jgi:alpha-tubulin suppressor-like RCC1 family protein
MDGHLYIWADSRDRHFRPLAQQVTQAAAGEHHFLYLSQGSLFAQGDNSYGQCGIDNIPRLEKPLEVPFFAKAKLPIRRVVTAYHHTFVITDKGDVFGFGFNLRGQLGLGHFNNITSPAKVILLLPGGRTHPESKAV